MTKTPEQRLNEYLEAMRARNPYALGYPMAKDCKPAILREFLGMTLNNMGDPFGGSTYGLNSKEFEVEVIDFYAQYFRAPADDYWGYVTSGGSEGNLFALNTARELLPDAIVLSSDASHYSIAKSCRMLRMDYAAIATQANGEIDYDRLAERAKALHSRATIVVANVGTTMTEAKDDVRRIRQILKDAGIEQIFIHADGAYSGGFLRFTGYQGGFDISHGADSVAVSGHKFFGVPIPSGIVITRRSATGHGTCETHCIGSVDSTLTGSRSGLVPLAFWHSINTLGYEGFERRYRDIDERSAWVVSALQEVGIAAWRNPHSLMVIFPTVPPHIKRKWQLASDERYSHMIPTPNTPYPLLEEFVADMRAHHLAYPPERPSRAPAPVLHTP